LKKKSRKLSKATLFAVRPEKTNIFLPRTILFKGLHFTFIICYSPYFLKRYFTV